MPPRFSVIVPVYNRAKTVSPTLQSVVAQTFGDFECIVIDDGSTDGDHLRSVVEALNDARFRYVRKDNGGASAARNTGIGEARGEYVALLDSDDRWLPEKLQRDANVGGKNTVVFSPMLVERHGQHAGQRPRRGPRKGEPIGDYVTRGQGFVPSSTVVVPTNLARSVGYDERLCLGDDADFAIRLRAAGAEFHFIDEAGAVMNDDETGDRLSRSTDWQTSIVWLDRVKPLISRKAALAFRGWHVARMAAQAGAFGPAFRFYVAALAAGAFTPSLALKAGAQLVVPRTAYNWMRR